jgi:hypothetical protein
MSNVENVLADLRGSAGGDVVIQNAAYWLSTKMGVHGQSLAGALNFDFANPPPPPVPDPEPESQAQILARAAELVGRLETPWLRQLEETVLDALQSSACDLLPHEPHASI